jgi:hypothetical protein
MTIPFGPVPGSRTRRSAPAHSTASSALTEYVETHLLDVEDQIALMDKTGIERAILSLTSPGVQ